MADELQGRSGHAAWKEQREAIAQRNADARKRAQVEQKQRDQAADGELRAASQRERADLQALNDRLDRRRSRG